MSIITYKCPQCGGDLKFDPETQTLKCDFCLSSFSEEEVKRLSAEKTHDLSKPEIIEESSVSDSQDMNKMMIYTCPSCGAQIVTDDVTSATICCYCHNPVVLSNQLKDDFKPSKIIPFSISSKQAVDAFLKWKKKYHFLPKDFSAPSQLEKIAGVYIPYWLVDSNLNGQMIATCNKIKTWRSGNYRYTKTDIYHIYRNADMSFHNIAHDASKRADDKVMDSIGPFDYSGIENFSPSYLSGFIASKYDVTKEEVFPILEKRIKEGAQRTLNDSIVGYTSTSIEACDVNLKDVHFHYSLMPVWLLTYLYKGATYTFAMNGQTGKLYGGLPLERSKLTLTCVIIFIVAFIVILIGGLMI